jgi:hypothetical protein
MSGDQNFKLEMSGDQNFNLEYKTYFVPPFPFPSVQAGSGNTVVFFKFDFLSPSLWIGSSTVAH